MNKISFSITGDALVTQRMPKNDQRLLDIHGLLMKSDVRFTNLETSIHNYENDVYPSRHSGGDWIAASPGILSDLRWLGFNIMSAPNNHSMDWSHNGLVKTIENLEREGIVYAGVGMNLAEASRPKYLETPKGRVAIIAVNTTFRDWHPAGEQRSDFIGRPGINPLHFATIHRVRKDDLESLKTVARQTEINKRVNNDKEEIFQFGDYLFEVGEPGTYTTMDKKDANQIKKSIQEAIRMADIVLVSNHSHEMKGTDKSQLADFQQEFAHMCIDAGANAYIGHGPHVIRGIEIYKERPIFHGLGDFFYQAELIEKQPAEFYDKYGEFGPGYVTSDGYDFRIKNEGKMNNETNPKTYESFIGNFNLIEGCVQNITIHPITLGFEKRRPGRGTPELASKEAGERILNELRELSSPFGTNIQSRDGIGVIETGTNTLSLS
ncbi:CapA family protein [Virgibacillus sp. NKC19-3]|uniref:CapA family protein n=1 Tax=Virgibacillus saliphilus TaxID=2831674 RepID=UPI001C9AEC85|nr:CapA family protein [Virgibacillus sp. NKC19-3]MBY7144204.1 CapA family protein [Virgibacillus sp. NKC19-3]